MHESNDTSNRIVLWHDIGGQIPRVRHSLTYLPTYLTAHVHTKGKNLELGGIFILRGHTSKRLGINGMK